MANEKIYDRINEQSPWQDITEGNKIFEAATSKDFCTGEWRTATPVWSAEKCKQCLLGTLTTITARAAASVQKSVRLERSA